VGMPGNIGNFSLATPFTVSAWINPVLNNQNHAIYGNTWSDGGYLLRVNAENKVRFIIVETGGAGSIYQGVDSNVLTPGWHHVVGTWDGTNVHVFVDGVEESITPIVNGTMTNISTTAHTFIGSTGQLGSEQLFQGSIDDVRVYSEALDGDQVSDLFGGECSVGSAPESSSPSSEGGSSSSEESSSSSSSSEGSSLTCTEDGLYAFWKFEETVGITADDSVGSHDGTLENGLGFGGEAAPTDASILGLAFDGTDDDVLAGGEGAATDFAFGTTDFTVSAWTKVASAADANRSVLGHFDNSSGYKGWGLYFYNTGNVNFFGYGNNGANDNSFAAPSVLDGGWHNVTGVYKRSGDNLVIETYVDGVLVGTTPSINVGNMFISTPMTLGRYTFQPNFKGGMDEVRIYNRALTAEEVSQIAGGCYAPESSSSSSEGGSSSSSSSEGGGTDGGSTGGSTGGTTGGNNIFSFSSFNGGHHGNTTDQLGAATNFVINNNPNGAFGGGPDPRICAMQRRLGPNPIQGKVDFVAKILAKVLDISQEQIALYLVDPDYCAPINAAVIRPAKPVAKAAKVVPFYVDANGIPVSRGNLVFDLCVANKAIPYPLVKSTGKSCDDYYISDGKWKHPDHPELEYFTLKLKPKVTLTLPTGYKVTQQSLTVGKK
ncbi:MAG TPA: LamG domain-containing protein, partial [Candidatus Peribacteria bacterium]|nr:LamG domain-containing protein [Candidatus Peribacteria bacterium]